MYVLLETYDGSTENCSTTNVTGSIPVIFFAILGRGPRAFQIGKSSVFKSTLKLGNVIVHNYVIFGQ